MAPDTLHERAAYCADHKPANAFDNIKDKWPHPDGLIWTHLETVRIAGWSDVGATV